MPKRLSFMCCVFPNVFIVCCIRVRCVSYVFHTCSDTYPSEYLARLVLSAPPENRTYEESNLARNVKNIKFSECVFLVGK